MADYTSVHTVESPAGEVVVLSFVQDRIPDDEAARQFARELIGLEQHARLLIDFAALKALCSAAISKLIALNRRVQAAGGQLKMCAVPGRIRGLMGRLKLDRLFDIREAEEQTLESFLPPTERGSLDAP